MQLKTERLILRPFTSGDLPKFAEINADAEVMRYFQHRKQQRKRHRGAPHGQINWHDTAMRLQQWKPATTDS